MDRKLYIKKADVKNIGKVERIYLCDKTGEYANVDIVFRETYTFLYNLAGCSEAVVIDKDIEVIDNFGIKVRLVYSDWSQGIVIPYTEEVE